MANTFVRAIKNSENPFVMMRKEPLQDKNLSWKAKGLLAYLLSLPDDWKIYETELVNHATDGKDSLKSGIKELLENGYLTRESNRSKDGQFSGYDYKVFEVSNRDGKTATENPTTENPSLLINNSTNNDLTNSIYSSADAEQVPYKQIIEYLNEKTNKNYSYKASGNRKLIKARFNEGYSLEDFKKVIDVKCSQWMNDSKMRQYLRPATLFNQKFDSYLNEEMKRGAEDEHSKFSNSPYKLL